MTAFVSDVLLCCTFARCFLAVEFGSTNLKIDGWLRWW